MTELPTGTVTFLFTDIEGSTRLLQAVGERWPALLQEHNRLLREAITGEGGVAIRTEGDAFFAVFQSAPAAVAAAVTAQRSLAGHPWPTDTSIRVRMGLHTGEGTKGGDDYVGLDVHRGARIAAAGHGGQVLASMATAELVRTGLPAEVELQDLGEHRLKDLARTERIFQLRIEGLPADFPPIRSLDRPTNLPAERTGFIGRHREVARIKELIAGPGLLTLTGPGGSGKTRLALQAARELLREYSDGVFFVELAPVTDPQLIPSSIASAVGAKAEGRRPVHETLRDHLRELEMLLVIDNFEQVIEGANLVADLLATAPQLSVLATSREPLHISAEREFPVPPLDLPDAREEPSPDLLVKHEAIALFLQRATAADPGFRITDTNAPALSELCRRLDGLPLAIELAASRVKVLSPEAILARIEQRLELLTGGPVDLPQRQRTLRGAIAWSYDLLDQSERALFRRLSVFAGGWTLEDAEAVTNPKSELARDLLPDLESLVNKSLVRTVPASPGAGRFELLETIREFAAEQLDAAAEAVPTRDRHLDFFLQTAEAAEPHLRSLDQKRWLDELEREHDNLRAGLRLAIDTGQAGSGLRLVGALWRFWHLRGHLAEGRRWAEEVMALPGSSVQTLDYVRALTALGGLAYWQEDIPAFRRAYEEALTISRVLGDPVAVAEGIYNLAYAFTYEGDLTTASAMFEESRVRFEGHGLRRGVADTLWILGIIARLEGDLARSRTLAEESLHLHHQLGDRFGATDALHTLGRTAFAQGDLKVAQQSFLDALSNDEELGNWTGMAIVLDNLAAMARVDGQHVRALRLAGASAAIKEAAGGHAPQPLIDLPDPRIAARETLDEAAIVAAWEEGRAMPLEQALAYARSDD